MSDTESHEVRNLRWKLKQISKQCGKQGATIYALRNENAALREAVTFNPGDRARLFAQNRDLAIENRRLAEKNAQLREALPEQHRHHLPAIAPFPHEENRAVAVEAAQ